jgi:hypothetical protein
MRRQLIKTVLLISILALSQFITNAQPARKTNPVSLKTLFSTPPSLARPWVFWYWYQASVSRQGITADLEAMKQAGIAGAYLMPIKGPANPPYMDSTVVQLTPAWWAMVRHAMNECKRLGLKLAFHVSDGFALAGGPWITPELSMQKMVWTEKQVKGGALFLDTLAHPYTLEGYYKDVAVFAFPSPPGAGLSTRNISPVITSSREDSNARFLAVPGNKRTFGCEEQCWVQYQFDQPFTCRSITISSRNNYQSNRLIIEVSDDGKTFRSAGRLDPPRSGWQDTDENYTHAIPPTTARFFRFIYDRAGSEPGAEDLDAAKWKQSLRISGIELSAEPRIHQYEEKNGSIWRISPATTEAQLRTPDCVPLNAIIDLSGKMDANGKLNWQVPAGNWTILRMGHTSTGHRNETAGGGKGLECDKFNPATVRFQFDHWFGEALRQAGPELAKSVLELLHVDSWECGSQNWSVVFRDEFKKRRAYDPMPYMPAMAGVPVGSADISERFLLDIRQTIADLVSGNFYVTLADLAHKNGVLFSAESVAPTMVSDGMLHYQHADYPMGEFWLRSPTHDKPNDMLDAISGAHVYGKSIIQAEAFTELRMAWDEHPGILKTLMDRNFALGINRLVNHVFVHNPWMDRKPGMTLDAIGLYFQRDQTWWKQGRAWMDYISRCQALLQWGEPVTDIAVFTGEDLPRRAVLPDRLVPLLPGIFGKETVDKEKMRIQNIGLPLRQLPAGVTHSANMAGPETLVDPLHGYAYDSYNPDALLRLSKPGGGRINLSTGPSYQLLIIPGPMRMSPNNFLSEESARKIKLLMDNGSHVLFGTLPENTAGHADQSKDNKNLMALLKSIPTASGRNQQKGNTWVGPFTDPGFERFGLAPDFIAIDQSGKRVYDLAWTHRRDKDRDIYFISNQKDTSRVVELSLRIKGRIPELWNPLDGSAVIAGNWKIENGRTKLPVHLDANASLFVVLQKASGSITAAKGKNWKSYKSVQTINYPWTVKFDPVLGGSATAVEFTSLQDWSQHADSSIRYYSGTAQYNNSLNLPSIKKGSRYYLNLGRVADIADVYVNGIFCGTAWTAPFRLDITKAIHAGANSIRIDVTNTWANRMIGDHRLPEDKRVTRTIAPYRLEGSPLLPAGLLGAVRVEEGE